MSENSRNNILIIEDKEIGGGYLSSSLNAYFDITEASNGFYGLKILKASPSFYDAVILDLSTHGVDGYEVLECISSDAYLYDVPVIVIKGTEKDINDENYLLKLGASEIFYKPLELNNLIEKIQYVIKKEERLKEIRHNVGRYDPLTGLLNIYSFSTAIEEKLKTAKPNQYLMICLDFDQFNMINSRYGRKEGDKFLKFVSDTLRNGIYQAGGLLARDMGDLFYMFVYNLGHETIRIQYFQDIIGKYKFPIPMTIDAKVGIVIVDKTDITPDRLINRALMTAKKCKELPGVDYLYFKEEILHEYIENQLMVDEFKNALEENQFKTYYMPIVNYQTNKIIGIESLVRWERNGKILSPAAFVELFEKNGYIRILDAYMYKRACALQRKVLDLGFDPIPISVNASKVDLDDETYIEKITSYIKLYNIDPKYVPLEIVESTFMTPDKLIKAVKDLQNKGFHIHMDDFGSGYSTLNMLKELPINVLKLDMRFLVGNNGLTKGKPIINCLIQMAHDMDLEVIAEGVEYKEQADFLLEAKCPIMQGYYFSKPICFDDLKKMLIEYRHIETDIV